MEEIILEAIERVKQTGRFSEVDFVPGIIYGDGIKAANSVKFSRPDLRKILSAHGPNAKVWIQYNKSKKYGFIKEVQRHPVTRDISHIDVQIVSVDHEIKLQIPITYKGEEELKSRQLSLQVYKSDIAIVGKMALIPESILVDVTGKELGDSITMENFDLDKNLTIDNAEEIYGMITHLKVQTEEVVEAAEATEATEVETEK